MLTTATDTDETGVNDSSNGDSRGEELEEPCGDDEEKADMEFLLTKGGAMLARQSSCSQTLDDDYDPDEDIRNDYEKIKTSTWVQKKLDKTTGELSKLLGKHEKSKRELIKPVKELIANYPEKKKALTLLSGLLSDACMDGAYTAHDICVDIHTLCVDTHDTEPYR